MNKLRLNRVSRSQMNEVSVPSESNQTKMRVVCVGFYLGLNVLRKMLLSQTPDLLASVPDRAVQVLHQFTNRRLSEKDPIFLSHLSHNEQPSATVSSSRLFHSFTVSFKQPSAV